MIDVMNDYGKLIAKRGIPIHNHNNAVIWTPAS